MARWSCSLTGLLAWAVFCAGCAANRPANPFASMSSKSSKSQMARKDPPAGVANAQRQAAASERSVAQTPAKAKGPGSSLRDAPRTASAGDQKSPSGSKTEDHDPETMALIDKELRDATAEERANFLADFKGLHPATIQQVLRGRRMAINHELTAKRNADPRPAESIQHAAGESASGAARYAGSDTGVQNAAGIRDAHSAPGSRSSQSVASATGAAAPRHDGYAPRGTSPVPYGHNTGYRLNPPDTVSAQNRSAAVSQPPIVNGLPNSAPGTQTGPSSAYVQTAGQGNSPTPRSPASRPAVVTIGAPTIAGEGTVDTASGAATDTSQAQLARLISLFEAEVATVQPGENEAQRLDYTKKQVNLRRLYLMSGQQERALQAIPGIDPADQEFWQQTFWGETNYFDATSIPSAAERAAQTVTQLQNAVLRLQEKAHLELRNVNFCHRISSFGNYEKYTRDEFSPGQDVLLYAEVANIHSDPIPDGKFRTSLKSTLEILRHGPQGEVAERIDLPETVDICRTHRRDYFHSYQFTIPTKLSLGPHVLKLTVEDQISHRVTTYTLNFMVK